MANVYVLNYLNLNNGDFTEMYVQQFSNSVLGRGPYIRAYLQNAFLVNIQFSSTSLYSALVLSSRLLLLLAALPIFWVVGSSPVWALEGMYTCKRDCYENCLADN